MRGRGKVKQAAGHMCLENRGEKGPGGLTGCLWHRNDNGGHVTSVGLPRKLGRAKEGGGKAR